MADSKKLFVIAVMVIILGHTFSCFAAMSDGKNVQKVHVDATVGCTVCHPQGNFKDLNEYGKAYLNAGRSVESVKAIDASDSDGDGVTNADEIKAGTNPGDATTK